MKRYELVRWARTPESGGAYTDVSATMHWTMRGAELAYVRARSECPGSVFGLNDRWARSEVYNWRQSDTGPVRRYRNHPPRTGSAGR